jgi:signal transduction histidine kinase
MRHLLGSRTPLSDPAHTGDVDESSAPLRRRRGPVLSVRTRIVAVITLVAALGLLSVGAAVYLVERQRILEQIDARLEANLDSARFIVAEGDPEVGAWESSSDALRTVVQRMSPDDNTGAAGLVAGEVAFVPGLALDVDLQSAPDFAAYAARQSGGDPVIGTYAEDGFTWQYLVAPIAVQNSPQPAEVLFVLAYDVEAELAEINVAARVFLIASAIALAVIAAAGTIVAGRLLRPLRQMRETAEKVSAQALSERLPIIGRDDVSELAQTMNDMLDRLDEALDSQRRLLSDVGHELKTPITIVRGYVEVMDPADPADVRETQELAVDELDRMGRLVQDLAGAASLHGPSPVQPRAVDTVDLMRQIAKKAERIVGAEVELGPTADVVAVVDPERITQAMLQLAQNAVTHGGGRLMIGCRTADLDVEFWVRDHGRGVPDAAKTEVFDRFHRGADAAGRSGSGLGLNIVKVIAAAHGGTAHVADAQGGGAVFVLRVPRGVAPPPGPDRRADVVAVPPRPPLPTASASSAVDAVRGDVDATVAHGSKGG